DSLAPASSPFGLPVYVVRLPPAPFCETPTRRRPPRRTPYNKFRARKSSRGSSKLQLPKDLTNLRRDSKRSVSIFQSRHAKISSLNESDSGSSSSSIIAA